jgi:hypothetical protein
MTTVIGSGDFKYEALESWQKLPDGCVSSGHMGQLMEI